MQTISPAELMSRHQNHGVELIDVRTPKEFHEAHVEYARNVPLNQLDPTEFLAARQSREESPIYLICKTGSRGSKACKKFEAIGFYNVVNVDGGTDACLTSQLPVTRGKKTMSLERQVRIAAGILIVLGVVLGFSVHVGFHALAGFVGAGLVFAGITDTCGMGMLIARMPWNQVKPKSSKCAVE